MFRPNPTTALAAEHGAKTVWLACALLVLATFATYWNSLRVPFFFDDPVAILENPTIRSLRDIGIVLSPPRNGSGVAGRPLVNLSLAINYALGGTSVTGYHVTNILFHAASGLLLFACVRRTLLRSPRLERYRPIAVPFAFSTAALWLLHPLQTESVSCVIQRTELLVGLFYLLTLYCFMCAEEGSKTWGFAAVVSCLLGMATKEVMVTAPLIILLYDRTFVAGSFVAAWKARSRIYLALAASWLLLGAILVSLGGARGEAAGFSAGVTWWSYALKQCEAVILYLRLTIWPHPLVVFYGVDVVMNPVDVWPQLLLLTALVSGAFYALWKKPLLGFCAMWFFIILAPSSSVVPLVSQTVSEHRMYLSVAAPLIAAIAGIFACMPKHAPLVVLTCAAAFGVLSARRNVDYRNDLAIWTDTVAKVPNNARARVNLGATLNAAGHPSRALAEYQIAVQLDPKSAEALNNLATLCLEDARPAEAIEPCRAALRLRPKFSLAHNNLGTALVQTGQVAEGVTHLQTAISLKPELSQAHCNLASAFVILGETDQAITHGEEAVRLNPNLALAYFNLSYAFIQKKQPDRAIAALEAAVRIKPNYPEAHSNLGGLYYQAGNPLRAIPHFEAALRTKPGFLDAHNNLASALYQTGHPDEAIEHYRAVIRLKPDYLEAHLNLGLVLARTGRISEARAAYTEALRLRPDDERAKNELARLQSTQSDPAPR